MEITNKQNILSFEEFMRERRSGPRGPYLTKKMRKIYPQILKLSTSFGGQVPNSRLYKMLDCSRGTFYRYLRELKQEMEELDNEGETK